MKFSVYWQNWFVEWTNMKVFCVLDSAFFFTF